MKRNVPIKNMLSDNGEQTKDFFRLLNAFPMGALLVRENGAIAYINSKGTDLLKLLNIDYQNGVLPGLNVKGENLTWIVMSNNNEIRFTFNGYPISLDGTRFFCLLVEDDISPMKGRYNERLMTNLIEQSNDGIVIFDHHMKCIEWNKGMEKITGFSYQDVADMTMGEFLKIVSPKQEKPLRDIDIMQGTYRSLIKRLLEKTTFNEFELKFRKRNGDLQIVQYRMFPLFYKGRLFSGSIVRDVTEMKQAEATLRASESKFRTLVEAMGEGAFTLDLELNILFSNPVAESMYGVETGFFIGKNMREFIDIRYASFLDRQVDRIKTGLSDRYEIEVADFRGNSHVVRVTSSPWRGANREIMGSIVVFSDITEWKIAEEHLHFTSTHDEVTSLYNRNFYEEEKKRLASGRRFPVTAVIIDLDEFKAVNDTLGHNAGDLILHDFGRIIRHVFRAEDVVARIGGDEFAILLPETDKQAAREAVERLRDAVVAHNVETSDHKIYFSVGTGTANAPEELEDAIRRADTRMYHEKKVKKNSGSKD